MLNKSKDPASRMVWCFGPCVELRETCLDLSVCRLYTSIVGVLAWGHYSLL